MDRLKDKIAIVTGGARGIGRAIVDAFVSEGAKAVFSFSVEPTEEDHPAIHSVIANVCDADSLAELVENVKAQYGTIDILVNNAGITKDGLLQKMESDAWDAVLNVNLKGVFNITKLVAPIMIDNGSGSIVNITSVVGLYGNIGQTNYAASKAGLIGMTYSWAKEFTRKGATVRTNAVAPGYVATEMMLTVPEKVIGPIKARTPLGRLGQPEEIANAVLFLASDESSYVNGHVLEVTGGLRL